MQTHKEIYALIRQAVLEKKIVTCVFKDKIREFCPHILGLKRGQQNCLAWQVLPEEGWRAFSVLGCTNVSIREGVWKTDPEARHDKPQTSIDTLDVQVTYDRLPDPAT